MISLSENEIFTLLYIVVITLIVSTNTLAVVLLRQTTWKKKLDMNKMFVVNSATSDLFVGVAMAIGVGLQSIIKHGISADVHEFAVISSLQKFTYDPTIVSRGQFINSTTLNNTRSNINFSSVSQDIYSNNLQNNCSSILQHNFSHNLQNLSNDSWDYQDPLQTPSPFSISTFLYAMYEFWTHCGVCFTICVTLFNLNAFTLIRMRAVLQPFTRMKLCRGHVIKIFAACWSVPLFGMLVYYFVMRNVLSRHDFQTYGRSLLCFNAVLSLSIQCYCLRRVHKALSERKKLVRLLTGCYTNQKNNFNSEHTQLTQCVKTEHKKFKQLINSVDKHSKRPPNLKHDKSKRLFNSENKNLKHACKPGHRSSTLLLFVSTIAHHACWLPFVLFHTATITGMLQKWRHLSRVYDCFLLACLSASFVNPLIHILSSQQFSAIRWWRRKQQQGKNRIKFVFFRRSKSRSSSKTYSSGSNDTIVNFDVNRCTNETTLKAKVFAFERFRVFRDFFASTEKLSAIK